MGSPSFCMYIISYRPRSVNNFCEIKLQKLAPNLTTRSQLCFWCYFSLDYHLRWSSLLIASQEDLKLLIVYGVSHLVHLGL